MNILYTLLTPLRVAVLFVLFGANLLPNGSTAQMVFTSTPTTNANNVSASSVITIDFDTDIDLISVHNNSTNANEVYDDNIIISGNQSGQYEGIYSVGGDISIVSFSPTNSFKAGEQITVVVSSLVLGTGGETAVSTSFSFVVASGPFEGAFLEKPAIGLVGVTYGATDYGDYDNDGDLDLIVVGWDNPSYDETAKLYNNVNGVFTDIAAGLTGVYYSDAAWGDYDGDGNLDLIIAGGSSALGVSVATIYRNNGGGTFTDIAAGLQGVDYASVDWGDFDSDGDIDLAVMGRYNSGTGQSSTTIYQNNGGSFTDIGAGLTGLSNGSADWVDYDTDGDLDLFVTGADASSVRYATVYRNDGGGVFVDGNAGLPGVEFSAANWGDYDNDGDLDLVMMGGQSTGTNDGVYIYQNNAGVFTDIGAGFSDAFEDGSTQWGDFDGDGDLDLALTGQDYEVSDYVTRIYRNDGGVFNLLAADLVGVAEQSTGNWGDFDGDGDLDLLLTGVNSRDGNPSAIIYENTLPPFITTWVTTDGNITIPTTGAGYDYNIAWRNLTTPGDGDGIIGAVSGDYTISGLTNGATYEVSIWGTFPSIYFNNAFPNRTKIKSIEQWGANPWQDFTNAFRGCNQLEIKANDIPNLSGVTSLSGMFGGVSNINAFTSTDMSGWNTSNIMDMSFLFDNAFTFNLNVNTWDVSNVTNMDNLFNGTAAFNQPLDNWDVSSVTNMSSMFYESGFNQPIDNWVVSSVNSFFLMFGYNTDFNQPLNNWDVSSATNLSYMFNYADAFNQPLNNWDVSNVTDMSVMFEGAASFDQSLGDWDISNVADMSFMLDNAGVSTGNYDATLIGWEAQAGTPTGVNLGALGVFYCTAVSARAALVAANSWTISDAGILCLAPIAPSNLFVTELSATQLDLTWADNSSNETGFTIERSDGNYSTFIPIITVGPNVSTYSDNSVTAGNGYFYRVIATNATGDSGPSNEKFGSTIAPASHALHFDGIDDEVTLGNPDFSGFNELTVEGWIKPAYIPSGPADETVTIIGKGATGGVGTTTFALVLEGSGSGAELFGLVDNGSTLEVARFDGGTGFNLNQDEWVHIALTWANNSPVRLYINAVEVDATPNLAGPLNIVANDLLLGTSTDINEIGYEGELDEFRIWDIEKSAVELQNNKLNPLVGNEANLIAYYRFDQGVAGGDNTTPPLDLLPDRGTNNFNGNLTGFALVGLVSNWVDTQLPFDPFITTWQTDNPGDSNPDQITIPTIGAGYNYDIYWEEVGNPANNGTEPAGQTGDYTITFPNSGQYRVEITGNFPRIYFNAASFRPDKDSDKLLTIEQWGDIAWTSMQGAFSGCSNLNINASDIPNLSLVSDISEMFYEASSVNSDLNNWDVSNVTNMKSLFREAIAFNQPLDTWEVGSVSDMSNMFYFASSFNQSLDGWDVSSVTNMALMFGGATSYNQYMDGWDVSSVTNMNQMFSVATSFNEGIVNWDVSNVTDMTSMFNGATAFNQNIDGWNVSAVTDMAGMFRQADAFSFDLNNWIVSSVTDMDGMFSYTDYNGNIKAWDVANVSSFNGMFENNASFNQDISTWDVTSASDMRNMFRGASSFDQNLGSWNVINLGFAVNMLNASGLSVANYDNLLAGWAGLSLRNNVSFGAQSVFYCASVIARDEIIANFSWFINDAGPGCISVFQGPDLTGQEILNAQPAPIDFGSQVVGLDKTFDFTLRNNLATDILGLIVDAPTSEFTVSVPSTTITAGSSITIQITFNSSLPGNYNETISIDGTNIAPFLFGIMAEATIGPQPEIAVFEGPDITGTPIADGAIFGTYVGDGDRGTDLTGAVTISNIGSADLVISDLSIGGTSYSLNPTTPPDITISPGASETIIITLDGTVSGAFLEDLIITNNDIDESAYTFPVGGDILGPIITVFDGLDIYSSDEITNNQPAPINIGTTAVGKNRTIPVTIANFGPVDLDISSITVTGLVFTLTGSAPVIIPAEIDGVISEIVINLTLNSSTAGVHTETVTIQSDDDANPTFTFDVTGSVISPPHIYWTENIGDLTNDDEIHRADLDGNDFSQYYSGFADEISGIVIDTTANRLYWTDAAQAEIITGEIGTLGLSSGPDVLVDYNPLGAGGLYDLALDLTNGHIYFTYANAETGFTNKIVRTDLDGSNPVELIDLGFEEPFGIDLDLVNNKIYYTTNILGSGHDARLYRANYDGSNQEELEYLPSATLNPIFYRDVKIDPINEIVYWSVGEEDVPGGQIFYNSINEAAPFVSPTVFSFPGEPRGIDIDLVSNKLYWVCRGANDGVTPAMIMRSDLDGSNIENIFTVTLYPPSYPPGPPGSAFIALDLRGASSAPTCPSPPSADAGIDQTVCEGSIVNLNGVIGGTASALSWTTSGDGSFDNPSSATAQYTPGSSDISTGTVTLTLTTDDPDGSGPCIAADASILITIDPAPSVDAGADQSLCANEIVTLSGTIAGSAIAATWTTSGDGSFDNSNSLMANYTFGISDIAAGIVDLSLTTTATAVCAPISDLVTITISQPISVVDQNATQNIGETSIINPTNGGNINMGDVLTTTIITSPTKGSAVVNTNGTINYTSNEGNGGVDSFEFQVCNQCGLCSTAIALVTLTNEPPVVNIPPANGQPGGILIIDVLAGISDKNGNIDQSSLKVIIQPGSGATASFDNDGNLSVDYSGIDFVGTDQLTIEVCDFDGLCTSYIITIEIAVPPVIVYNAVSPNGDGKHDYLELENVEFFPTNTVVILNRWGDIVFKIDGYNNSNNVFTGYSNRGGNGELPSGTYYYKIDLNNGSDVINGFFTLRK